ncbi:glycosyltransferase family 2 protein [Microlunatus capsulatus]
MVIPCYDVERYVGQTVASLRRSASPDVEFLFVDDASTDATAAVLEEQLDTLPGARLLRLPANRGLAGARNAGLDAAGSEYVTFLDGDDFVGPGYYPQLLAVAERLRCDLVRTDHVQVKGRERTVHRIGHGPRGVVGRPRDAILPVHRVTSVDAPYAWAGIYHRRLVDDGLLHFSERLRTCEDRPWIWRLHLRAASFAVVGLHGLFYRRGVPGSLTQVADERQLDFLPAFDQILELVSGDRDAALLLPKAVRSYCSILLHHLALRERYAPELAAVLDERCRAALRRMPAGPLAAVVAGLDPDRADRLRALQGVAA